MTGPEHFAGSEDLAEQAARAADKGAEVVASLLAQLAQVHATLALVAATIDAGTVYVPDAHQAWRAALGAEPAGGGTDV